MDPIERLSGIFGRFPGIGPRQAGRFVQFLLRASASTRRDLADAIISLGSSVHQCPSCMRFHTGDDKTCAYCSSKERSTQLLAIVASDADLSALERGGFRGRYFVLGGTVSLASEKMNGLRLAELLASIPGRVKTGLTEIVLAFPANPEGDFTARRVRDDVSALAAAHGISITTLGRGLSTGSELEYADPDTIKSALENRH